MDPHDDSQATQQATQNALDPRRIGKQNSGFSDDDISDIICLLYPNTDSASREVQRLAASPKYSSLLTGRYNADAIESDLYLEDDAQAFGKTRGLGDHAVVLKLSYPVKNAHTGFAFGRNADLCDICFTEDPNKRLSNIHFRIYVNRYGVVMLQDKSTNGTIVDGKLLKRSNTTRVLESGSTIKILMHQESSDLVFLVRIPRRDGKYETAYRRNLQAYLRRVHDDPNRTIGPEPGGPVNLFPPPFEKRQHPTLHARETTQDNIERLPREWRGGDKYARVGVIGQGAFAMVYKVTSKYDGLPYAAKELDKRKFMKNGVLDQKVENEMKIMQCVHHENIVRYIEHFDWDAHQLIIVMEYVPGGDLGKLVQNNGRIKPISEPYVKEIAVQLIRALEYLHSNKITHRDVKPDNILIQSTNPLVVKLTDFGLSKMIDKEQTFLKTFCGTLLYCAPEVYSEYSQYDQHGRRTKRRERTSQNRERYDHAVDIWSLGGVLFFALTGSPPFPLKNGVSYTELLHHVMTNPLDSRPLVQAGVSTLGIDFLERMIRPRPETRASLDQLLAHPWLHGFVTGAVDQVADEDELEQGASQLSLRDRQPEEGANELMEPIPDLSEYESEKENYTFEQQPGQPNRLFGEVNTSAIGSSGAIPESRLNLPIPDHSFSDSKVDDIVYDSFDDLEDPSTAAREEHQNPPTIIRPVAGSAILGTASRSLGGAESILENLNMKSRAGRNSRRDPKISDLNTSKRKPDCSTSEELERSGLHEMSTNKRLKSNGQFDLAEGDYDLFASIPQIAKNETGRHIDYPLHKTTFWDTADKATWHLNYPEMTHLQYNAFYAAAQKRDEDFSPGKSPLWDLAMKYFPPCPRQVFADEPAAVSRRDDRLVEEPRHGGQLPAAPAHASDGDPQSESIIIPPERSLPRTVVASLSSAPGSLVPGISTLMTDPILSWGRGPQNTVVYELPHLKVPKNAFRILLWGDDYTASTDGFRPWGPRRLGGSRTLGASPAPEGYSFYIATKATNGLRINQIPLPAHEPKNAAADCKLWMKLHHGDTVAFWGDHDPANQAKVTFECFWGGSSATRPDAEPPTCVPAAVARRLDRTWRRAEKTLATEKIKAEAADDQQRRMQHMADEQERSRAFEQKRAEALRVLALRRAL